MQVLPYTKSGRMSTPIMNREAFNWRHYCLLIIFPDRRGKLGMGTTNDLLHTARGIVLADTWKWTMVPLIWTFRATRGEVCLLYTWSQLTLFLHFSVNSRRFSTQYFLFRKDTLPTAHFSDSVLQQVCGNILKLLRSNIVVFLLGLHKIFSRINDVVSIN